MQTFFRCLVVTVALASYAPALWAAQPTTAGTSPTKAAPAKVDSAAVEAQYVRLTDDYRARLRELAAKSGSVSESPVAKMLAGWEPVRDPLRLYLFTVPESEWFGLKTGQGPWREEFDAFRQQHASALFELAGVAANAGDGTRLYQLLHEVLREDPNHDKARKLLGYQYESDTRRSWVTRAVATKRAAGQVDDPEFGWLPSSFLARYRKGERYYRGVWISAAKDAEQHSAIENGWRIESENYQITTNHSLEEGVKLARKLETLHEVWRQAFIACSIRDAELCRRFKAEQPLTFTRPLHKVVYFKDRAEYNRALVSRQPQIAKTLGIYFDTNRTAYFFAGDDQSEGTIWHEGTHQLFHESLAAGKGVGRRNNFWIVEGIACYMESLAVESGYCTLGGMTAGRMPAARTRLIDDNFYVPLEELCAMGVESLQHDQRLPMIYSESTGLATFLMHGQSGAYRKPLREYLILVYSTRALPGTLEKLCGVSDTQLDEQYQEFMRK